MLATYGHEGGPEQPGVVIALNPARIGHVYPSYRYEVCREKVREYARATAVDGPAANDEGRPTMAPPTFAACFTVARGADMFADPELGAHPNLVHGSQEYEFHRPVRVGDNLLCTPSIIDIKAQNTMEFLTYQIRCIDADNDEPVVTSRATIIFFGQAG